MYKIKIEIKTTRASCNTTALNVKKEFRDILQCSYLASTGISRAKPNKGNP